ncbi:ribosome maturation factor RimP [Clostridia bacterium]|nr:ribosome maturation factor RimP [Clostridia bacterium]
MSKKKITQVVEEILENFLSENGYALYNTEFVKEGKEWYLRVFVDRIGGDGDTVEASFISTDDCEKISRYLSKELDRLDPIEQNYYLEVSSPGLDRELIRDKDFIRFSGKAVKLKLYQPYDGSKTMEGVLLGLEGDGIKIKDSKGDTVILPRSQVAKARLEIVF